MSAQRIQLDQIDPYPCGFTQIDNRQIWDRCDSQRHLRLRPSTLGIWAAMRSLPKGWQFHEPWLTKRLGIGRDALRRSIKELEQASLLKRHLIRDQRGRYVKTIWHLYACSPAHAPTTAQATDGAEPSNTTELLTEFQSMGTERPLTDFPSPVNPTAGKPTHLTNKEKEIEERTTTEITKDDLDWSGLPEFGRNEIDDALPLIRMVPPQARQDLIHELAYALRRKSIRGKWQAWLRGVIKNGFKANHDHNRPHNNEPSGVIRHLKSELPYENEVNWLRQQHHYGAFDEAELEQRISQAARKHMQQESKGGSPS